MINNFKKIISILNFSQKLRLILIFFLILISVLFESIGISLIIPIMGIVTNESFFDNYPFILEYLNLLGINTQGKIIFYTLAFLAIFFFTKLTYNIFYIWYFANYTMLLKAFISKKLFSIYLNNSYDFHLKNNSSILIRNIMEEVNYSISAIKNMSMLFVEFLVVIGISLVLIFYQSISAISIIIFSILIGYLFYKFTKNILKNWAIKRQKNEALKIQHLQQGLFGIKELKILKIENSFIKKFNIHNLKLAKIAIVHEVFKQMPRLLLELIALVVIISVFFYLYSLEIEFTSLITSIALFGAAAFRILPSLNRILQAFQDLSFNAPSINIINEEFKKNSIDNDKINSKDVHKINFKDSININNLSFSYSNDLSKVILNNLNLEIKKGDCIGIVGKSGQGKSTFVDLLLGLIKPTNGQITIDGFSLENIDYNGMLFGYVPQNIYLTDDSIVNNIAFGESKKNINYNNLKDAISNAQLSDFIENLENGLNTIVGERGVRISGGQLQRVGIARALYRNPDIIILDEATSSLDIETENQFMNSINNLIRNKTLIIISHRFNTLKNCNKIYELKDQKLSLVNKEKYN